MTKFLDFSFLMRAGILTAFLAVPLSASAAVMVPIKLLPGHLPPAVTCDGIDGGRSWAMACEERLSDPPAEAGYARIYLSTGGYCMCATDGPFVNP